jgi:hypothetical protein
VQIKALDEVIGKILPGADDPAAVNLKKGLKSVRVEARAEKITKVMKRVYSDVDPSCCCFEGPFDRYSFSQLLDSFVSI